MTQLHLWPAGYGDEGIAVDVAEVRRALEAYWTELARQGPDYYAAAAARKGSEPDTIEFGDLAWAVLLAGQPRPAAAQSLLASAPIDISDIPSNVALEEADDLAVHAAADKIQRSGHGGGNRAQSI